MLFFGKLTDLLFFGVLTDLLFFGELTDMLFFGELNGKYKFQNGIGHKRNRQYIFYGRFRMQRNVDVCPECEAAE